MILSSFRIALVLACAIGGAAPALAHAHLTGATPAADSTGAAPDRLMLQFSEGLELKFTGLTLTGPDGTPVPTGPGSLGAGDAARLSVPVTGRLAPGAYTVDWHAVATDGHKTTGRYRFTVKP